MTRKQIRKCTRRHGNDSSCRLSSSCFAATDTDSYHLRRRATSDRRLIVSNTLSLRIETRPTPRHLAEKDGPARDRDQQVDFGHSWSKAAILNGNAAEAVVSSDGSSCPGSHHYYSRGSCNMVWGYPSWCTGSWRRYCAQWLCQMTCDENYRSQNPRNGRYDRTSRPYSCGRYTRISRNYGACTQMTSQRVANASFERTGDWSMRFTCNEHFEFTNGAETITGHTDAAALRPASANQL